MAASGSQTIQLYYSTTSGAAPVAGNLASGEVALNITDGKLYYKDNAGAVQVLATKGAGTIGGANTQVQYNNNGVLAGSGNMTFNGTRLTVADLADSSLTSGRVTYATTGGNLTDSANLTFDGTNLTLGGGTANGVAYLNGSKVLTTGSALTFDGTNFSVGGTADIFGRFYTRSIGFTSSGSTVLQINGSSYGGIDIGAAGTRTFGLTASATDVNFTSITNIPLLFGVNGSEQMRLTSTGLGIGTSSPGYKLDVVGFGRFSSGVLGSGGLTMYGDASSASGLLLSTAGNLDLGVTPSAWSGLKAFEIAGVGSSIASASNNNLFISANAWYNGTNWRYGISSEATQYQSFAGAHRWYTAPAGVAGNAISFTQAMTLTTGGNLLVGTTTDGGQRARIARNGAGVILNLGDNTAQNFDISSNAASGSSGVITLDTSNGAAQAFSIGGTERARIDSSGNLLVGTTNSAINAGEGIKLLADTARRIASVSSVSTNAGGETFTMYSTGAAAYRFYVGWGGTVFATSTSISAISDRTLKENIRDLETGLTQVMALKPRRFDWKNGDAQNVAGFVAQEVEEVLPELVTDYKYSDTETKKSLKMGDILPTLVKAIQEQQAIITALTARVAALESNP